MRTLLAVLVPLMMLLSPSPGWAQSNQIPWIDVAVGYADLQNVEIKEHTAAGMFGSIEGTRNGWLWVVGEFSGTKSGRRPRFFGDPAAGTGAFLTGPKCSLRRISYLSPFVQVLGGVASSGDSHVGEYPALGIEPAAGIDVSVREHLAVRLAAGYRRLWGIRSAAGATASLSVLRVGIVLH